MVTVELIFNVDHVTLYFKDKLILTPTESIFQQKVLDFYEEGESYRVKLRYKPSDMPMQLTIQAKYLMELFPDQQNSVFIN